MDGIRVVGVGEEDQQATAGDISVPVYGGATGGTAPRPGAFIPTRSSHSHASPIDGASQDASRGTHDTRRAARGRDGGDVFSEFIMPMFVTVVGVLVIFAYNQGAFEFGGSTSESSTSFGEAFGLNFGEEGDMQQRIRPQETAVHIELADAYAGTTTKVCVGVWAGAHAHAHAPTVGVDSGRRESIDCTQKSMCPIRSLSIDKRYAPSAMATAQTLRTGCGRCEPIVHARSLGVVTCLLGCTKHSATAVEDKGIKLSTNELGLFPSNWLLSTSLACAL